MSQFGLVPDADDHVVEADPGRKPRKKRSHGSWVAVVVSLAVVIGLVAAAVVVGQSLLSRVGDFISAGPEDYAGPGTETSVPIVVAEGASASDIAVVLANEDVVASADAFVAAAARDSRSTGIQPGTYALQQQLPAVDALEVLVDPTNRIVDGVLIREGLRVEQTLSALSEQGGLDPAALDAAVNDPEAIGLPDAAEGDAEGFLYPATYEVEPTTSEADVLSAMTAKYREVAEQVGMDSAADLGYTEREIVTIASIIQAEARIAEDFPKVARVIYNRLDEGEVLGMDSTVAFANDVYTVFTTDEQRAIDSPYNTYRVAGLPPGPINSPGQDAIEAALNPADGPWTYFVTVNLETGEMKYAETLEEHNRNVAEAQANGFGEG